MSPGQYLIAVVLVGIITLISLTASLAFFQMKKWVEFLFYLTMGVGFFCILWQLNFNTR